MSTFCEIDSQVLIKTIASAKLRVVYAAPGISKAVAAALGACFQDERGLDVTVVLDPDEDVCRIGYGEPEGLALIHKLASKNLLGLRAQTGLRIGILLADDDLLVWSPTPLSVEAPLSGAGAPNGLRLGPDPGRQLAQAAAADGSGATPADAEIGQSAVTPEQVQATLRALDKNPMVPVDLARITRVFSTKLEFVETEVKGAKLSQSHLTISKDLLNSDVQGDLKGLIESRLLAFSDLRREEMPVPAFTANGDPACDAKGKQLTELLSEAGLERVRRSIDSQFIYTIPGHGRLIEKERRAEFEKRMGAFEQQMQAHSKALRARIQMQAKQILDNAVKLILARHARSGAKGTLNEELLRAELSTALQRAEVAEPKVTWKYKGITFEHTQNAEFRALVRRMIPPQVQRRLGDWDSHFQAAEAVNERKK